MGGVYTDMQGVKHEMMAVEMQSKERTIREITPRIFVKDCRAKRDVVRACGQPEMFKTDVFLYGPDFVGERAISRAESDRLGSHCLRNVNYDAEHVIEPEEPENSLGKVK